MPQLRIITEEERKGQRAELNSVKFKCANPPSSRSGVAFSDLDGNLHNVGKLVSYLHIVMLVWNSKFSRSISKYMQIRAALEPL